MPTVMENTFGPWWMLRRIAQGQWCELWQARLATGDTAAVALKRLTSTDEPAIVALFAEEQRVTCSLPPHPHVVHGIQSGTIDDLPYLAMRFVDGTDLRTRPMSNALPIAIDLADACHHVHRNGFVHGDVNPSNAIIDANGRATLCDFGIARALGSGGPVRGTHAYMAPDQVRGEAWTAATDVFALGIILWEMLAGERLFHRSESFLSMAAVVEDAVPPLADATLNAIVQLALAKDPAARISSAADLRDRLVAAST